MDIESIILELFDLILAHGFFHHIDDKLLDEYLEYFQPYFPQNGYLLSIDLVMFAIKILSVNFWYQKIGGIMFGRRKNTQIY